MYKLFESGDLSNNEIVIVASYLSISGIQRHRRQLCFTHIDLYCWHGHNTVTSIHLEISSTNYSTRNTLFYTSFDVFQKIDIWLHILRVDFDCRHILSATCLKRQEATGDILSSGQNVEH